MKSVSKKFVLITVLLQLKISIQLVDANFQFGDMLVMAQNECGIEKATAHYAIYVDGEVIKDKKPTDQLFHMIRRRNGWSGCIFTPMPPNVQYTVHNYLDGGIEPQSKTDMIKAIENLNANCGEWSWSNTCEHIATSIRYGDAYAQCNQHGTLAGWAVCPFLKLLTEVKKLPNAGRSQRGAAEAA